MGVTLLGGSNDGFNGVAVDASGNPVVTALFNASPFSGSVTLIDDSGLQSIEPGNLYNPTAAVIKFNNSGTFQWIAKVYNNDVAISSITTDNSDNIYFTGSFSSINEGSSATVLDASNNNLSLQNSSIGEAYLVKLDKNGIWQWGNSFGNGTVNSTFPNDVTIDFEGNIWIAGSYNGTAISFNGLYSLPASTGNSAFVVKYSSSGVILNAINYQEPGNDTKFNGITVNGNTIAAVGNFKGNNLGINDILLVTFNYDGTLLHTKRAGGTGDDIAYCIRPFKQGFEISGTNGAAAYFDNTFIPNNGSFLWNTNVGDQLATSVVWEGFTGNPVAVSPTTTTTYMCTFDNGLSSCSQNVIVHVTQLTDPTFDNLPSSICVNNLPYTLP